MKKYWRKLKNWRKHTHLLRWLARLTKPYMPALFLLLLLGGSTALISVGQTLINKYIIDSATVGKPIALGVAGYVVAIAASLAVGAVQNIYSTLVNERFAFSIRARAYNKVLNACWKRISTFHSGDVVTRLSSDIDIVATGLVEIVPSVFTLLVSFVAAFITLAWFDIRIALFALVLAPISALISFFSARKVKRVQLKVQETESAYKSSIQESVENLVVVKAFEGQAAAGHRLDELRNERIHWLRKRQRINSMAWVALAGSFQIGYIVAFAYSTSQLSASLITYGTMTVFLSLVGQIQSPMVSLSRMVPRLISMLASSQRIIELEEIPAENTEPLDVAAGPISLEVDAVAFGYDGEPVLKGFDLTIESGQFVALMGSSGIGKTTLLRLIMAYYEPESGSIRLRDSEGGSFMATAGIRHHIAYVPQGNTLLSGTIADNLRIGKADATQQEMWDILRVVAAEEFVQQMPKGLETLLGERGHGLSEGQSQRLAIARALLKGAPLLILDEATSSLDEATELAVLRHLRQASPRPTCIIITHRRSVLPFCDRCIQIVDGRVARDTAATADAWE